MFNYGSGSKYILSGLMGIIFMILGGVPLLKLKYATIVPFVFTPTATKIALLVGGILLLYYGFQIKNPMTGVVKITSMLTGLLLAIIGAMPLVIEIGWFNKSLPFIATLNIPIEILQGLIIFFGLYLLYDAYTLSRQFF